MRGRGVWVIAAAVLLAVASGCGRHRHHGDHATSHRSFEDAAYWSKIFDDPGRDEWQKPQQVVDALALKPGARVAEIGAGTGYFLKYLSRAVGPSGAVLAVEVETTLVEHLRQRATREGLPNVTATLAAKDDPQLAAGSVDLILIVDTYHHIDDRRAYFRRLQSALAPGGRIVIIDWHKKALPVGPPPDHKLPRKVVEQEMASAGYRRLEKLDLLPYQYVLIFGR